jgi:DNA-binding MarR family transcriptional regulator
MARPAHEATVDQDTEILLRASKVISAAVAHSLASVEEKVSVPGLRVLVMVRSGGALNLSSVAESLGVNASSASRTCERLVNSGLLDRRESVYDRRHVSLTLTDEGNRFVDEVMEERRAVLARVMQEMPPRSQRSLIIGLKAFVSAAESLSSNPPPGDGIGAILRWVG